MDRMNRFKITFLLSTLSKGGAPLVRGAMKRTFYVNATTEEEATRFAQSALLLLEGRTVEKVDKVQVHEVTMEQTILEALTDEDDGVAR
jgi:hypothetical protein